MKHIRGIVFDLDGTLLDTLETLAAAHNEALARHGHPPRPVDAYRYYIGNGARKCVERSLPQDARDDTTIDAVTASFKVIYDDAWRRGTQPYEGIPELVTRLRERGYALAVLSNKDHPFTQKIIEHFFDDGTFDAVQGHSDAVPHKPSPVGIRHIGHTRPAALCPDPRRRHAGRHGDGRRGRNRRRWRNVGIPGRGGTDRSGRDLPDRPSGCALQPTWH